MGGSVVMYQLLPNALELNFPKQHKVFLPEKPYIYIANKNFQKKFFKMKQKSIPQCAKHQRQWFETTFQSTKIIRGPSKGVWVQIWRRPKFDHFSMAKWTLQELFSNFSNFSKITKSSTQHVPIDYELFLLSFKI